MQSLRSFARHRMFTHLVDVSCANQPCSSMLVVLEVCDCGRLDQRLSSRVLSLESPTSTLKQPARMNAR